MEFLPALFRIQQYKIQAIIIRENGGLPSKKNVLSIGIFSLGDSCISVAQNEMVFADVFISHQEIVVEIRFKPPVHINRRFDQVDELIALTAPSVWVNLIPEFCTQLTAMIGGEKFSFTPADRGWEPAALQPGLSLGINQPEIVFNI